MDRTALVVVDVQNGFVTDVSRPVVPVIAELVERWTAAGRPVVFTRYLNHPGSLFERLMDWRKLADAPETDIVPELAASSSAASTPRSASSSPRSTPSRPTSPRGC